MPPWVPSERALAALLVLLLAVAMAFGGSESADGEPAGRIAAPEGGEQALAVGGPQPTRTPVLPTPTPAPTPRPTAPPAGPTATLVTAIDLPSEPVRAVAADPRAILPANRILSYYGHPNDPNMGIIGEYGREELLALIRELEAEYEAADPTRPVIPAYEVIASVAQNWPADDNTYLLYTGADILDAYAEFTAANDLLLILDIQIGHSTVAKEIEKVRPWLELPNVHLAIDPEFAMADGQIPGEAIGGIDASDITYAQEYLARLAAEKGLPPKVLIVHQFFEAMIRNPEQLAPVSGVQLVLEFDGFGEPSNKIAGYNQFVRDRPVEFGGIKLFYKQDAPVLTPQEIVALEPPPDLVIYQ